MQKNMEHTVPPVAVPQRPQPLWQPGEPLTFPARTGNNRVLIPETSKWIGGGNFGEVFSVRGMLQEGDANPAPARVAMKQFDCRENTERAVKYHDLLARLNFPVFSRYEAEREQPLILMPNGNTNRTLTVSQNGSLALAALEQSRLQNVENGDQLVADIIQTVRKATLFGIFMPFDAYFYFVQRKGNNGIVHHSVDDTDNVRLQQEAMVGSAELLKQNICAADQSLTHLFLHTTDTGMDRLQTQMRQALLTALGDIEEEMNRACEC